MEDLPTMEKLNLTMVKYSDVMNCAKRMIVSEFVSEVKMDVPDCDKDNLLALAKELNIEPYRFPGLSDAIQVVIKMGKIEITMWSLI